MVQAVIRHIAYHFPEKVLDNEALAAQFPGWTAEKIQEKTGITQRHISGENEFSSDLAVAAAEKLFASGVISREEIDYILLCTQSPDYFLPTTACLVHKRLGLSNDCGALDFNLGCSGFIYGLGLAKGLIETAQARRILLLTAETYSKFIHPLDKSVRTIFGDAAAAVLVTGAEGDEPFIGPFVYGTDGEGAVNLIVPTGGMRQREALSAEEVVDESGNIRTCKNLYMNGGEIFSFTLKSVPAALGELLRKSGLLKENVDLFVFHQANEFMLEALRKKMRLPKERFVISMSHCGNTVSATIPIALKQLEEQGSLTPDMTIALVGFGVGYSWAATMIRIKG